MRPIRSTQLDPVAVEEPHAHAAEGASQESVDRHTAIQSRNHRSFSRRRRVVAFVVPSRRYSTTVTRSRATRDTAARCAPGCRSRPAVARASDPQPAWPGMMRMTCPFPQSGRAPEGMRCSCRTFVVVACVGAASGEADATNAGRFSAPSVSALDAHPPAKSAPLLCTRALAFRPPDRSRASV